MSIDHLCQWVLLIDSWPKVLIEGPKTLYKNLESTYFFAHSMLIGALFFATAYNFLLCP